MRYPDRLMPRPSYRIIESDAFHDDWLLIRATSREKPNELVSNGSLSAYLGLSVSLCGVYEPGDVRLTPRPKVPELEIHQYWVPGDQCLSPDHVDCTINSDRTATILPLQKWHGVAFPINRDQNKSYRATPVQGRIRVEHKPTRVNYWHFEIHFTDEKDESMRRAKRQWQRNAVQFAVNSVLRHGGITLAAEDCPEVPRHVYDTVVEPDASA